MRLKLVLHNIRSTYNVGAILRTAEGTGVEEVVYSGYTPRYRDERLLPHLRVKLDRQIEKVALGAEGVVRQGWTNDLPVELERWREEGWVIVGLENNLGPGEEARRRILGEELGVERMVLILGEEVKGIPDEVRERVELFLEIPMVGRKESFNVSVAAGMALWALLCKKH